MTKINCSNFSFYVCNAKKAKTDLDPEAQKKLKVYQGLLACTLGVGHAVCGIVYLIKRSCDKGSKTNQVGQKQLNPSSVPLNNAVPVLNSPEEKLNYFANKFKECIDHFDNNVKLSHLAKMNLECIADGIAVPNRPIEFDSNHRSSKEAIMKALENAFQETENLFRHNPSHVPQNILVSLVLTGENIDGFETSVRVSMIIQSANIVGFSGPSLERTNKSVPLPTNLSF